MVNMQLLLVFQFQHGDCMLAADAYGAGNLGQSSYAANSSYASGANRQAPQVTSTIA